MLRVPYLTYRRSPLELLRPYLFGDHDDGRFVDSYFPPVDSSLGHAKSGRLFITEELVLLAFLDRLVGLNPGNCSRSPVKLRYVAHVWLL